MYKATGKKISLKKFCWGGGLNVLLIRDAQLKSRFIIADTGPIFCGLIRKTTSISRFLRQASCIKYLFSPKFLWNMIIGITKLQCLIQTDSLKVYDLDFRYNVERYIEILSKCIFYSNTKTVPTYWGLP